MSPTNQVAESDKLRFKGATMDDEPVDITTYTRRQRWTYGAVMAVSVAAVASTVAFGFTHHTLTVSGEAKANPVAAIAAQADNKAAEEAEAAAEKKRADEENLRNLELDVRDDMQRYFNDPENMTYDRITVYEVHLIAAGENLFEGAAKMSANGGTQRDIPIHVRADDKRMQWSTDQGALLPLFR